MFLEILAIVLFLLLIVYFVVSIIVFVSYKKMKKSNRFLTNKYGILNKKSFLVDRTLSLYNLNKVSLNEVNDCFLSLYKEIIEIDSYLSKE